METVAHNIILVKESEFLLGLAEAAYTVATVVLLAVSRIAALWEYESPSLPVCLEHAVRPFLVDWLSILCHTTSTLLAWTELFLKRLVYILLIDCEMIFPIQEPPSCRDFHNLHPSSVLTAFYLGPHNIPSQLCELGYCLPWITDLG